MYFPYLYGRQGECRALEDLAGRLGSPQKVFPLIEPVVERPKDLIRALDQFKAASDSVYLIVNPSRYKLQTQDAVDRWRSDLATYISDVALIRPVLEIRPSTALADVVSFFAINAGRELALSIRSSHLAATDLARAGTGISVVHFLHSSADPSGYSSGLGPSTCVEVRDSFRTEARNADYLGEERFTTEHLLFAQERRMGFSDYTLLPGLFNASGGPLGAAVIHLSFIEPSDGTIWVEHFVSDETRQYQGTQPSKLLEAMAKLDARTRLSPAKFLTTPGITAYETQFLARTPTSPTYNKRQQISHHIDTVAQSI